MFKDGKGDINPKKGRKTALLSSNQMITLLRFRFNKHLKGTE